MFFHQKGCIEWACRSGNASVFRLAFVSSVNAPIGYEPLECSQLPILLTFATLTL